VITTEDWNIMEEHIQYDFLYDNHFTELKEAELQNERLALLTATEPYIGKYYSNDWVRRNVLRQTDVEITEQDAQIEKEIADGTIPDPADMMLDPEGSGGLRPMPMPEEEPQPDVADASLRSSAVDTATTADTENKLPTPKGGEI
jgi:hypothetical protein